jgi:mannose-6-phosphate isomerase-like protein (cupin superfamily)
MDAFNLVDEQSFDTGKHVEKILRRYPDSDVTVACWEPGQVSPNHCHPNATEIYFCFQGGGVMRTPDRTVDVEPGAFVVHPPGEMHEYENGPRRSLLFRVRFGDDMAARSIAWRGNNEWKQTPEDVAYFGQHPVGG